MHEYTYSIDVSVPLPISRLVFPADVICAGSIKQGSPHGSPFTSHLPNITPVLGLVDGFPSTVGCSTEHVFIIY